MIPFGRDNGSIATDNALEGDLMGVNSAAELSSRAVTDVLSSDAMNFGARDISRLLDVASPSPTDAWSEFLENYVPCFSKCSRGSVGL